MTKTTTTTTTKMTTTRTTKTNAFSSTTTNDESDLLAEDDDDDDDENILKHLLEAKKETSSKDCFESCIDNHLDSLTTLFFDRLSKRITKLREEERGEKEANELNELAMKAMIAVESRATFERASEIGFREDLRDTIETHERTLQRQLSSSSASSSFSSENTNYSIETQVKQRWAALTKAMETTGNENAISQKLINREKAKSSATELLGRAKLNTEEAKILFTTAVPPEQRIIEYLLEFESGPERAQILTDALSPADENDLEAAANDEEIEVVSTTAARLSCALEVYLKDEKNQKDTERIRTLANEVKERL
jgi:hypothetical protein